MPLFPPLNLPWVHGEYEGTPLSILTPASRIKEIQESHKSRPDDVYIATYQKCGTTWLQQILCLLYDFPQGEERKTIVEASPWIEHLSQEQIDVAPSPRVFKTHMRWKWVPKADGVKYIYCYRNPKDCAVSFFHHMSRVFNKANQYEGNLDDFIRDVFIAENAAKNGRFFEHVAEWLEQKSNDSIYFLTYEDLSEDFEKAVTGIAKFLGLNISAEKMNSLKEKSSFEVMKKDDKTNFNWLNGISKDPNADFMRKGKVGDWKNHLSEEQSKKIEDMANEILIPLGAKIKYEL